MKGKLFLVILLLAIFLRVWTLNSPFYADENVWPYAATDHSKGGFNFKIDQPGNLVFIWSSPPLAPLLYRIFTWPLGVNTITMRLLPLILGLVNISLTYILAKRLFNKKVALLSMFIMSVSFWHIIASFLVEHDGSFLMLFWLLFFIAFSNYEYDNKKIWLVLCGVCLGFALLTKYTGILIFGALCIYLTLKYKSVKPSVKIALPIFLIGMAIFSIFPILALIFDKSLVYATLVHGDILTLSPSLLNIPRSLIYLTLWATPLLSAFIILIHFVKEKKDDNKFLLLFSWIGVPLFFYLFTIYAAAIDRYMSVMIPPLSIVAAYTINKLMRKKEFFLTAIVSIVTLVFLIILNNIPSLWVEHDISDYVKRAMALKWNFIFQFHGGSGPAFMTSFYPLGAAILLLSISLAICFVAFLKKSTWSRIAFSVFLGLAFSFNLFLICSWIVNAPFPDVGKVTYEIADYLNSENFNYIFSSNYNLYWYINKGNYTLAGITVNNLTTENIKNGGGIVVIEDYPKTKKSDRIWQMVESCKLKKQFVEKGLKLGYIYECNR